MRQTLTQDLFDKLKDLRTSNGVGLTHCIQSGLEVPGDELGVVACDGESYSTFAQLFDAVLTAYHSISLTDTSPLYKNNRDSSELDRMETLDYSFVLSSQIQSSRNIKGYAYSPIITSGDRTTLEASLISALDNMKGEFSGSYWGLEGLPQSDSDFLKMHGLLLNPPSPGSAFDVSGSGRDWPQGRGHFTNKSPEFVVWVNGLDHVTVVSQTIGGDICSVFEDWITAINGVERCLLSQGLEFDQDERLGYLTTSLGDVGSGFHASMTIRLKQLTQDQRLLHSLCSKLSLRAVPSEESDTWKISNRSTLLCSEVESIQQLIDGVAQVIAAEKEMQPM
jgi:protein-arginine kinase